MKKIVLLIFVFILLVLPLLVSATDPIEIGPYKQNSIINLLFACTHSGGDCSASASCNMTVDYPNTTHLIYDQNMSKNGTFFNYTLPDSSALGKHTMLVKCLDSTKNLTQDYYFYITKTGEKSSTTFNYIIETFLKLIFFAFMIFLSLWGIRKLRKKNETQKTPYLLVALLRVLWGIVSYALLFMSPFIALFLFDLNFPIGIIQRMTLNTYFIIFLLIGIVIIINIFWFSGHLLLKFGGLDVDKERTNKVLNDINKFYTGWDNIRNKLKNKIFRK